jgi:hypothetical protein
MGRSSAVGLHLGSLKNVGGGLGGVKASLASRERSFGKSKSGALEIQEKDLKKAREDRHVRDVVAAADEQEQRLEREGLIHS